MSAIQKVFVPIAVLLFEAVPWHQKARKALAVGGALLELYLEQRASCEDMERDMALGTTHDHAEMKGVGRNPMNLTHERCQQILAQT